MQITKRIAEREYCYTEITFDSLKEYEEEYINFLKVYKQHSTNNTAVNNFGVTVPNPAK